MVQTRVSGTPAAAVNYDIATVGRDVHAVTSTHEDARPIPPFRRSRAGYVGVMASYEVNQAAVAKARQFIDSRQYVLDSAWGDEQPDAAAENAFLEKHSWDEYAQWHLGLTDGATEETKSRYAFVFGDFRRVHRMGLIACRYRAAEWRHKEIELAAHELLQYLDENSKRRGSANRR